MIVKTYRNKTIQIIRIPIDSELILVKVHLCLCVPFGISIAVKSRNRDFQCTLHSDKLDSNILKDAYIASLDLLL